MGRVIGAMGQIMKPALTSVGYPSVQVGKLKTRLIHRMVLETFDPENESDNACHNNGIRHDNRLENLRWDTWSGNFSDKNEHGTSPRGERNGHAKMTEEQVLKVKSLIKSKSMSHSQIASAVGCSKQNVADISCGRRWGWLVEHDDILSAEVG
jgi:predicted XRE-type DNA-binding protein